MIAETRNLGGGGGGTFGTGRREMYQCTCTMLWGGGGGGNWNPWRGICPPAPPPPPPPGLNPGNFTRQLVQYSKLYSHFTQLCNTWNTNNH